MPHSIKTIVNEKSYVENKPVVQITGFICNPNGEPYLIDETCVIDTGFTSGGVFLANITTQELEEKYKINPVLMDTMELANGEKIMVYMYDGCLHTIDGQNFLLPFDHETLIAVQEIKDKLPDYSDKCNRCDEYKTAQEKFRSNNKELKKSINLLGLDALKYFSVIFDGQKKKVTITEKEEKTVIDKYVW